MKKSLFFLGMIFSYLVSYTQMKLIDTSFVYKLSRYEVVIFENSGKVIKSVNTVKNSNQYDEFSFFNSFSSDIAITASIVDSNCNPKGLFIENGSLVQQLNTDTVGVGNFYMPDNGVYYISNNSFKVSSFRDFRYDSTISFALQTGPLLINRGLINRMFGEKSTNKFIRCGIGLFSDNNISYVVFVKSKDPVNFFEFSSLFLERFNCDIALNLESGKNASFYFKGKNVLRELAENIICRYLVLTLE